MPTTSVNLISLWTHINLYSVVNTCICIRNMYIQNVTIVTLPKMPSVTSTTTNCLDSCTVSSVVALSPGTATALHLLTLSIPKIVSPVQVLHCSYSERPHFHNGPQYKITSGSLFSSWLYLARLSLRLSLGY